MNTVSSQIDGVSVLPLRQIVDERGAVLHMLRRDWPVFSGFGEVYFSEVNPGAVKAWKRHRIINQRFAAPWGRIRLVVYDDRPDSPSRGLIEEIIIGRPDHYNLVCLPPLLWYGFQGIAETPSILANCADIPHDPEESETLEPSTSRIPFKW